MGTYACLHVCALARIGLCSIIGLPSHLIHLLCVVIVSCLCVCASGTPSVDELILMGILKVTLRVIVI